MAGPLDLSTVLSTPQGYATPEQLRVAYEYSQALQRQSQEPIKHWTQGVQHMVGALMGGMEYRRAAESQHAQREAFANALAGVSSGPSTPAPQPGTIPSRQTSEGDSTPSNPPLAYAESGNNSDARNPLSSAAGLYQFTKGTWDDTAAHHPDLGLGSYDSGAWRDTAQQEKAKGALDADNAKALQARGYDPSDTNLNLAHRFGATGASRVLGAAPGTQMASLEPSAVMAANPDLAGRTAGDVTQKYAQLAQNLPPHAQQTVDALRGGGQQQGNPYQGQIDMLIAGVRSGLVDPQVAAVQIMNMRQQMVPQYSTNESGQMVMTTPGRQPQIVGEMPGWRKETPANELYPGAVIRETRDANGLPRSEVILPGGRVIGGVPSAAPHGPGQQVPPQGQTPQGQTPQGQTPQGQTTPPASIGAEPQSMEDLKLYQQQQKARQEGLTEAAKEQAKRYVDRQERINKMSDSAQAELPQLQILQKLIKTNPNFYSGLMSDNAAAIDQIMKATGLSQGEMASAIQLAKKLGAAGSLENIRELAQQGTGAIRVPEMHMIEKSNYDPENTPEANAAVVDIRARALQRSVDVANKAQTYADKHGGYLDRGFDQELRDYYKANPLFSDQEVQHYSNLFEKKGKSTGAKPSGTTSSGLKWSVQ